MLPKQFRLRKTKDFDLIWKKGRSFFVKTLGAKVVKNELPDSRFGFVVSTKISKKAVVRNRVKRLLRQMIHEKLAEIKPGFDVIFYARPGIQILETPEFNQQVKFTLTKLGLLNEK
ncbi:MAG: ribonuclease P protein component [Patescibacteria group bacterium]